MMQRRVLGRSGMLSGAVPGCVGTSVVEPTGCVFSKASRMFSFPASALR